MMKIAVDFDGTIMSHPELYREIMESFRANNNVVGIITGRTAATYKDDLDLLCSHHIVHDFFYNASDFNWREEMLVSTIAQNKINMPRDDVVCIFKARMCHEVGIDVLFDDAADKIRLYLPDGCKTVVFKSPNEHNGVFPEWGKELVEYGEEKKEQYELTEATAKRMEKLLESRDKGEDEYEDYDTPELAKAVRKAGIKSKRTVLLMDEDESTLYEWIEEELKRIADEWKREIARNILRNFTHPHEGTLLGDDKRCEPKVGGWS